jgi:hypothetical protein
MVVGGYDIGPISLAFLLTQSYANKLGRLGALKKKMNS